MFRSPSYHFAGGGQSHFVPAAAATANEKRKFPVVSFLPRPFAIVAERHDDLLSLLYLGVDRGLGVSSGSLSDPSGYAAGS